MAKRRKVVKDEIKIMSRSHRKIVRSWSTSEWVSTELDEVALKIKNASGVHCDRSKILTAFSELFLENSELLNMKEIVDGNTLKSEIVAQLKKAPAGRLR